MKKIFELHLKIRTKLIISFLLLCTLSIIITQSVVTFQSQKYARLISRDNAIEHMYSVGSSTDLIFNYVYDIGLYISSEKNISDFIVAPVTAENYTTLQTNASNSLSILPYTNQYIKSILLLGLEGQKAVSGSNYASLSISEEEKMNLEKAKGHPIWTYVPNPSGIGDIYYSRYLRNPLQLKQGLGYIKIQLNPAVLNSLFLSNNTMKQAYYIVDNNSELIYSSSNEFSGILPLITTQLLDSHLDNTLYVKDENCFITPHMLSLPDWYLFSITENTYEAKLKTFLTYARFIIIIVCAILCVFLSFLFSKLILTPLIKLENSFKSISHENFGVTLDVTNDDEMGTVVKEFNHMSIRLNELYNKIYLQEMNLKIAQLDTLTAQINPHFLYNTLDTIFWMSEFHNTKDVSQMISSLSKLFRISLSGDQDDMIPLSLELEHVSCYLYIQQIRYGDKLNYSINVDDSLKEFKVLKLVLQPIVENAIKHGIDKQAGGCIEIHICKNNCSLVYKIINTGVADAAYINSILKKSVSKTGSIGLSNIQDRIHLKFGENYHVTCESVDNRTIFQITLPIILY